MVSWEIIGRGINIFRKERDERRAMTMSGEAGREKMTKCLPRSDGIGRRDSEDNIPDFAPASHRRLHSSILTPHYKISHRIIINAVAHDCI